MEGAPFGSITDFREKELILSAKLPFLKRRRLSLDTKGVMLPDYLTPCISAHPTPIEVDVDIDRHIAVDIDRDVGRGNRLPQGRCRGNWGQERNRNCNWTSRRRGSRINAVGQIRCRSIVLGP